MTFKARHIFVLIAAIVLGICVFVVFLDYRDDFHRALNVPPTSHYADDIPNLVTAYHTRSDVSVIYKQLIKQTKPCYYASMQHMFT